MSFLRCHRLFRCSFGLLLGCARRAVWFLLVAWNVLGFIGPRVVPRLGNSGRRAEKEGEKSASTQLRLPKGIECIGKGIGIGSFVASYECYGGLRV